MEHCLIQLIASEKTVYSRILIRIRQPIYAILDVFVPAVVNIMEQYIYIKEQRATRINNVMIK